MPNTPRESRRSTRSSEHNGLDAQRYDHRPAEKVRATASINTADPSSSAPLPHYAASNRNEHVMYNNSSNSGGNHGVRRSTKQQSGASLANETRLLQAKDRTNSAPLLELGRLETLSSHSGTERHSSHATTGASNIQNQDDDEVAGAVGAIRHFQPFQSSEVRLQQTDTRQRDQQLTTCLVTVFGRLTRNQHCSLRLTRCWKEHLCQVSLWPSRSLTFPIRRTKDSCGRQRLSGPPSRTTY